MEPPVSEPRDTTTSPADTLAAEPLDEPPARYSGFTGFLVGP